MSCFYEKENDFYEYKNTMKHYLIKHYLTLTLTFVKCKLNKIA